MMYWNLHTSQKLARGWMSTCESNSSSSVVVAAAEFVQHFMYLTLYSCLNTKDLLYDHPTHLDEPKVDHYFSVRIIDFPNSNHTHNITFRNDFHKI
jgi:hypothetical protein